MSRLLFQIFQSPPPLVPPTLGSTLSLDQARQLDQWVRDYLYSEVCMYVCVYVSRHHGHTNDPIDMKFCTHTRQGDVKKWASYFFENFFFQFFFFSKELFWHQKSSFQHNFASNSYRNMLLVPIPMFSGTRNRMVTFLKGCPDP